MFSGRMGVNPSQVLKPVILNFYMHSGYIRSGCMVRSFFKLKFVAILNRLFQEERALSSCLATPGSLGRGAQPPPAPTFLQSKKKKGEKKGKQRKGFKAETIKRLSPRSKCYCLSNARVSRIQKMFQIILFSVPWPVHVKSISHAL